MFCERLMDHWLQLSTANGACIKVIGRAHPRCRRLRLTIIPGGARVTYPRGTPPVQVSAFLRQHADWLERELELQRLSMKTQPCLCVGCDTQMPLRGEEVPLRWAEGCYPRVQRDDDAVLLVLPRLQQEYLPVARGLLADFLADCMRCDVAHWMVRYVSQLGLAPMSLRIRPLQSQWGSLDSRDRINLDLALALAPPTALRYVLVHELCHLKERNHSPRFWHQVSELDSDWKAQRSWLREHGVTLKLQIKRLLADTAD